MILDSFNWRPDRRFYRVFGFSLVLTGWVIAAVLWWKLDELLVPLLIAANTTMAGLVAALVPQSWPARVIYWIVSLPAFVLGTVVSTLLVGVVYYVVVTPIGLVLRATGKDPLGLRGQPESFWRDAAETPDADRYERQF